MAQNILSRVGLASAGGRWGGEQTQKPAIRGRNWGFGDLLRGRCVRRKVANVITGLAHTGVCVPDCEAAVAFYRDVVGLRVLSPPYVMAGNAIRNDMGEPVSTPR